jgi:hypothetical protein
MGCDITTIPTMESTAQVRGCEAEAAWETFPCLADKDTCNAGSEMIPNIPKSPVAL